MFRAAALVNELSSGLEYVPGAYAATSELRALVQVAGAHGGVYATHMQAEGEKVLEALDEALEVARSTGTRLQVSHCKASGHDAHGASAQMLRRIAEARRAGLDVRGDQYPYRAFATSLAAMLPTEANVGGAEALRERLRDPATRRRLHSVAETPGGGLGVGIWREVRPDDLQVIIHDDPAVQGRTLAELLDGREPWDALCDIVIADPQAVSVCQAMSEQDVLAIMADPLIGIASDSTSPVGPPHPRTFGTFPRFLGHYVRERGVVQLPEAVRKCTSAAASQFGLRNRGWLGVGAVADIVVFDADTIDHAGTYQEPSTRPTGVRHVMLSGRHVVVDGEFTGERAGRALRHR